MSISSNAVIIYPKKIFFLFSWFTYFCAFIVPILFILWIFRFETNLILQLAITETVLWGLLLFIAYPYYTISVNENKLNGPTLWGWRWRRLDLDIAWLDKEKILKHNPGRMLGIVIFYTRGGEKMLTLGLSEEQINQILALASEASAVK